MWRDGEVGVPAVGYKVSLGVVTKYVEAYGLRYVLEGVRQDLLVVWSLSTGG